MSEKIEALEEKIDEAKLGGGQKRIDAQHQKRQTHCARASGFIVGSRFF